MGNSFIGAIILILIVVGAFTYLFYHPVRRFIRRRSELKDETISLGQKEPHPLRNLSPEELVKLNSMIKTARSFSPFYILIFIYALIYVFTELGSRSVGVIKNYPLTIYLFLGIPTLYTFLAFYRNREKARKMNLDLTSQVFLARGKVYKESNNIKRGSDLFITVRGVMFDGKQKLITGAKLFDALNHDQEVSIEYSPNSKYVWKIN